MTNPSWLLLLYALPAPQNTERVNLWRKLKKFGAIQLKTSAYVLPDTPTHHERFQWLAKQIVDDRGEATLLRVNDIEGLPYKQIVQLFNDAREKDYVELLRQLKILISRNKKRRSKDFADDLEKSQQHYEEIRERDYFNCPRAQDVQMAFKQAQDLAESKKEFPSRLNPKKYLGRSWLTRPRPEGDRVGSAWLIRKWIDPEARFIFANTPAEHPEAIPYDIFNVEFSHHKDDCTFETLIKRFNIQDKAAMKIAEMIHDADLEDNKFKRPEMIGIDQILKGLAKLGRSDEEILVKGFECFDALYAQLKTKDLGAKS